MGTDALGWIIAAYMTQALLNSLQVGFIAGLFGTLVGVAVGFMSAYFGRWIDAVLRILIGVFIAAFAWAYPARQV